jgi:hypothetical protein
MIVSDCSAGGACRASCCFSRSSAALIVLLLLNQVLLVVFKKGLRAFHGEVGRENRRTLPPLGAAGIAAAVFDIQRPGLLTCALAFLRD